MPFVQEYHEGFQVDEKITEANDVRAIQPDKRIIYGLPPKPEST